MYRKYNLESNKENEKLEDTVKQLKLDESELMKK